MLGVILQRKDVHRIEGGLVDEVVEDVIAEVFSWLIRDIFAIVPADEVDNIGHRELSEDVYIGKDLTFFDKEVIGFLSGFDIYCTYGGIEVNAIIAFRFRGKVYGEVIEFGESYFA